MKVVELKKANYLDSVAALRSLADRIESGEYGNVTNVHWIVECDNGALIQGLTGNSVNFIMHAHWLLSKAQHELLS